MLKIIQSICLFLILFVVFSRSSFGQESYQPRDFYKKSEHMVAMRDGADLFTQVYTPRDETQTYPILLMRTPYGIHPYGVDRYHSGSRPIARVFAGRIHLRLPGRAREGSKSEGEFIHHVPYNGDKAGPQDVDESSDVYDTIEWLLANVANHNGTVGQWGISYAGWQTAMGMIDAHPALKASSPQGTPADQFIGDDYFHNGAFRLMYAFGWTSRNARVRVGPTTEETKSFEFPTPDGYRFFLELGPVANVNKKLFDGKVPTWNEFVRHGVYDSYWQSKNVLKDVGKVGHPVLNVRGVVRR